MKTNPAPLKFTFSKNQIKENHHKYLERISFFKKSGFDHLQALENIIENISVIPRSVLEIGTGKGYLTVLLSGLVKEKVISIDIDNESLKIAAMHAAHADVLNKIDFLKLDANALPFEDSSFDLVISSFSFHHFEVPFGVLAEMIRLTKHQLFITDFNQNGFSILDKMHKSEGRMHHKLNYTYFDIVGTYLKENGFKVTEKHDKWQKMVIGNK